MSEISFIYAPIGGGKSFFSARAICMELRRSERMIVTNLPVWIGSEVEIPKGKISLAEWCHEFCERPIDVGARVYVLEPEQVKEFYRYYPSGDALHPQVMPLLSGGRDKGDLPDLEWRQALQREGRLPRGCFFVLDEVHLHFGAREWQSAGRGVERYMSQLRKLNDDIFLVSQHPEKVDKNFRRNATEYVYIRNREREKMLLGVTCPGKFKFHKYPSLPMRGDKPSASGSLTLADERYGDVYDTMAGVGLAGSFMPEEKRKGGHWWRWVAGGLVACFLIWFLPRVAMGILGKSMSSALEAFHGGVNRRLGPSLPGGLPAIAQSSLDKRPVSVVGDTKSSWTLPGVTWSDEVFWTGVSVHGASVTVILSDETSYISGDGHLQFVQSSGRERFVQVDGVRYRWVTVAQRALLERRGSGDSLSQRRGVRRSLVTPERHEAGVYVPD